MKILVLGSGLMGPAAAYNAMNDPEVERVVLCDLDVAKLDSTFARLSALPGGEKIGTEALNLADRPAAIALFKEFNVILAALPWSASMLAFQAALDAGVPIVDLAIPEDADLGDLRSAAEAAGGLVLLGCGLEPGLTEIVAKELASKFDRVDELHIKCGGVPEHPTGPLGYKIVFGGTQLPLRDSPTLVVEQGAAQLTRRYSGTEPTEFEGVGMFESWHEGMMPWLLEMDEFRNIREGSQKTIRWPGYANKITVLMELGFLSREPIDVDGCAIPPKRFLDTLLYPHVRLDEGEGDITLFRVDLIGEKGGQGVHYRADMVDHYDRRLDFTSMARTTAFTGMIVARMIGRGDISGTGLHTSESLVTGAAYTRLIDELAGEGIEFRITTLQG